MCQVLTHIFGLPLYGFGLMLCVALFLCTWIAGRRGEGVGFARERIPALAMWLCIGGVIGAGLTFLFAENRHVPLGVRLAQFYRFWDGGLVFYGSVAGGLVAYL